MLFYFTLDHKNQVGFFPCQKRVGFGAKVVCYLSKPFPLVIIQLVLERLTQRQAFSFRGIDRESIRKRVTRVLEHLTGDMNLTWQEVVGGASIDEDPRALSRDIDQLVLGKQLSIGDLGGLARELGLKDEVIIRLVQSNVEQGWAQWVPSVKQNKKGWQCQRCGEKDVEEWPSIYGLAATCRSCESIGVSTSLNVLYRDRRSLFESPVKVVFQPHWPLTEAQSLASGQVLEFLGGAPKKALLWAACGAGKTEVCFPSTAWALAQGKSVLFAAPRQDVIHDIAPRLQRDFPNYPVQVLTGNTPNKFQNGGMVLATTHQVLRFWQSFDVIFLDEMDAFPYRGSRALEWGVSQALRQGGKLLYLTATPSPEGLKEVQHGKMLLIRLPARYHRKPLPVPIWIKCGSSLEPNGCTDTDIGIKQIELSRKQGPVLVFVPKISWVAPWTSCLKHHFPFWRVEGSYSADSGRDIKLRKLKHGQYDIFVSTTILERGITLPGIQVVVLGADHPVFDERALVQMAGRVGRTKENPGGKVIFLSKRITMSIKTALRWIEEQNRLALKLGLID